MLTAAENAKFLELVNKMNDTELRAASTTIRNAWKVLENEKQFQAAVQFRLAASAVGVPQRVVHGIGRNVMAHHQRYGLLQELGRLAGFLRIQFDDAGRFAGLTHGLGNSMANGQSIDQSGVSCLMKRPG